MRGKKKNTHEKKKETLIKVSFVEMAVPESNNPYVITMAHIDPALPSSRGDIQC